MNSSRHRTCKLAAAAIACLPCVVSAALNIDIRATRLNGIPLSGANTSKSVRAASVGDVVAFDVFAVVVGTNALTTDDKFISVGGSFKSIGSIAGDLLLDLFRSNNEGEILIIGFDGLGSSIGLRQDLDGDGDLDVGSNVDSNAADFWAARYASAPAGSTAGSTNPLTNGRRIGFGTFTVTGLGDGSPTDLSFIGRNWPTAANYIQDGVFMRAPSLDNLSPVRIQVPEPAVLSFALLGSFLRPTRRASRRALSRSPTSCRS
ncbi:hypothetical protein BH09PLA1_BH09PLA1_34580 [soil metagenome]